MFESSKMNHMRGLDWEYITFTCGGFVIACNEMSEMPLSLLLLFLSFFLFNICIYKDVFFNIWFQFPTGYHFHSRCRLPAAAQKSSRMKNEIPRTWRPEIRIRSGDHRWGKTWEPACLGAQKISLCQEMEKKIHYQLLGKLKGERERGRKEKKKDMEKNQNPWFSG